MSEEGTRFEDGEQEKFLIVVDSLHDAAEDGNDFREARMLGMRRACMPPLRGGLRRTHARSPRFLAGLAAVILIP